MFLFIEICGFLFAEEFAEFLGFALAAYERKYSEPI
jgi:hypothetical protein